MIKYTLMDGTITKTFDNGHTMSINLDDIPENIKTQALFYGLKQRSSDCHSSAKTDAERVAMTEALWDAFRDGKWSVRGDSARFMLESLDWDRLAQAVVDVSPNDDMKEARRDAVLRMPDLAQQDDKSKKAVVKKVKELLAMPKIAEAMGMEVKPIDDLLNL